MNILVGISNTHSVDELPVVQLNNWSIRHATDGMHFVGSRRDNNGRASTKIVQFDEGTNRGTTESGRIYELVGPSGSTDAAELVWRIFQDKNGIKEL